MENRQKSLATSTRFVPSLHRSYYVNKMNNNYNCCFKFILYNKLKKLGIVIIIMHF